jgi:hypothetical protein
MVRYIQRQWGVHINRGRSRIERGVVSVRGPISLSPYLSFLHSCPYPCPVLYVFSNPPTSIWMSLCSFHYVDIDDSSIVDDYVMLMTSPNVVAWPTNLSYSLVMYWSKTMWPYGIHQCQQTYIKGRLGTERLGTVVLVYYL